MGFSLVFPAKRTNRKARVIAAQKNDTEMTQGRPFSAVRDSEPARKSLGSILAAAREARKIPREKAAHDTRIRVQRLREIESDDLSHFSHPSYARLFLADYAKYLDIPFAEIRQMLPETGGCGTEGYQYLQDIPESAAAQVARRLRQRRRLLPVFAAVTLVVLCALGVLQIWITVRNIHRLNGREVARTEKVSHVKTAGPAQASADQSKAEEAVLFVAGTVDQTARVQ